MRIGVFSVLYQGYPFPEALDRIKAAGATAVEIGTGVILAATTARLMSSWQVKQGGRNILMKSAPAV
jgi:sugar phosphate isomerase/epimerase